MTVCDVAEFVLKQIKNDTLLGKTPVLAGWDEVSAPNQRAQDLDGTAPLSTLQFSTGRARRSSYTGTSGTAAEGRQANRAPKPMCAPRVVVDIAGALTRLRRLDYFSSGDGIVGEIFILVVLLPFTRSWTVRASAAFITLSGGWSAQ